MKAIFRYAGGAAVIGIVWFVAEYQSATSAIILLAAILVFALVALEDRLSWHGKLIARLNGIASEDN